MGGKWTSVLIDPPDAVCGITASAANSSSTNAVPTQRK